MIRLRSTAAAAALLAVGFGGLALAGRTPDELLAEADKAYALQSYKRAARAYERAAEALDQPFIALLGHARALLALERLEEVDRQLERALAATDNDEQRAIALNLRGVTLAQAARALADTGDPSASVKRHQLRDRAITAYRQAISATENPPPAIWANLAEAQSRDHRWADARSSVEMFLQAEPEAAASVAGLVAYLDCVDTVGVPQIVGRSPAEVPPGFTPPVRLHFPSPALPADRRNERGVAIFDTVIDTSGALHCVRPLSIRGLSPEFVADAKQTLSLWRFEPAKIDGEPKWVTYTLTVEVK